jgi:hypothetical protein
MTEIRPVPGFDDYLATRDGRVFSNRNNVRSPREIMPVTTPKGYRTVNIYVDGARKIVRVHHLILLAWRGPRPIGAQTRHLNGNPADNRVDNLMWGTAAENGADRIGHGTQSGGRPLRNGGNLNPEIAATVRILHAAGHAIRAIARAEGVSQRCIQHIVRKRSWAAQRAV